MRGLLLQTLPEIIRGHTYPIMVVHWPTRRSYMMTESEALAHPDRNKDVWLFKGDFS